MNLSNFIKDVYTLKMLKLNNIAAELLVWKDIKKHIIIDWADDTEIYWTRNNKKEGSYKKLFDDEQMYNTGFYKNGKKEGLFKKYIRIGDFLYEECNYKNDKKEGLFKKWKPNGGKLEESFFVNDEIIKYCTWFYYTDVVETKREIIPSGIQTIQQYYKTGKLKSETVYKRKKKISRKTYHKNGSLKSEYARYPKV